MQKAMSEEVKVTLGEFLKLFGKGAVVTIVGKENILLEEASKECVLNSEVYDQHRDTFVKCFNMLCGYGLVELCIELK